MLLDSDCGSSESKVKSELQFTRAPPVAFSTHLSTSSVSKFKEEIVKFHTFELWFTFSPEQNGILSSVKEECSPHRCSVFSFIRNDVISKCGMGGAPQCVWNNSSGSQNSLSCPLGLHPPILAYLHLSFYGSLISSQLKSMIWIIFHD